MAAHFQQEHRQREQGGKEQRFLQRRTLRSLALSRGIFHGRAFTGLRHSCGFVARLGNGGDQRPHIGAVADLYAGALCGQVHAGGLHARYFLERPLHAAHAGSAGHAIDLQIDLALRHGIAGLLHCRNGGGHHGLRLRGVVQAQAGFLGGQIDHGTAHARHFLERTLHAAHAGGTGHAFHRQFDQGSGHGAFRQCIHGFLHQVEATLEIDIMSMSSMTQKFFTLRLAWRQRSGQDHGLPAAAAGG